MWLLIRKVSTVHSAIDTAYRMLQLAKEKGIELSNLQLQKLVYIAHGYLLGWKGHSLIKEPIQAWRYGPVIQDVYHHFKENGRNKVPTEGIDALEFDPIFTPDEITCLNGVLDLYASRTPESLITITHQKDTPWDEIWNNRGGKLSYFAEIPNKVIQNHYRKVVTDPSSVNGL
ncbi:Panacea domain-containing protein [Aeromonas sp. R6-2]|uniref:Panacea domain-containing protein n=1 Tax=Aeromonas sp. R6-2 TaxID=3138472 RepID=UPI0034A392ED